MEEKQYWMRPLREIFDFCGGSAPEKMTLIEAIAWCQKRPTPCSPFSFAEAKSFQINKSPLWELQSVLNNTAKEKNANI